VRVLKISFIVSGLLFLYLVFKLPAKVTAPPQPAVVLIVSAMALMDIALGFLLPGFIARAALRSQSNTRTATPIQRWLSGYILSLAFFESCLLIGLVLHFLGARVLVVGSLFAAGLLAMLIRSPGAPPADEGASPA
jgi:hypothetical protein